MAKCLVFFFQIKQKVFLHFICFIRFIMPLSVFMEIYLLHSLLTQLIWESILSNKKVLLREDAKGILTTTYPVLGLSYRGKGVDTAVLTGEGGTPLPPPTPSAWDWGTGKNMGSGLGSIIELRWGIPAPLVVNRLKTLPSPILRMRTVKIALIWVSRQRVVLAD